MNLKILSESVQAYIHLHLKADANKIALAKSPFEEVSSAELAGQISAKKKSQHKLPTWYDTAGIYFPPLLSIEQCSSETTAAYKADLATGEKMVDLTAGFGVDSYYFAQKIKDVWSCEINQELSRIAAHNAKVLNAESINHLATDGIEWLKTTDEHFDTIYIDPARRLNSGKVFRLKDCTPDIVSNLALLLNRSDRVIVKTAPLLDLSAGLAELQNVSEIHIVSVKNECKELLWVMMSSYHGIPTIHCSTLNEQRKTVSFALNDISCGGNYAQKEPARYLYEPDVALLKSGAFDLTGKLFNILKLNPHSHLYTSEVVKPEFPGRIFLIEQVLTINELKKLKNLKASVIVRNFPDKAENLVNKYKVVPDREQFIVFTQIFNGYVAILARIIQHY